MEASLGWPIAAFRDGGEPLRPWRVAQALRVGLPGGRSFAVFEGTVGLTFPMFEPSQRMGSTRINHPCLGFE
jgi:hypothetical protein